MKSHKEIANAHRLANRKMFLVILVSVLLILVVTFGLLYLNNIFS